MKFRFTDRIDSFKPWDRITGRKAVSLEEYELDPRPEPALPESLVLESVVSLGRWLVWVSSNFALLAVLQDVGGFAWKAPAGMGEVLHIELKVTERDDESCSLDVAVFGVAGQELASGCLTLSLAPLADLDELDRLQMMWGELYAKA